MISVPEGSRHIDIPHLENETVTTMSLAKHLFRALSLVPTMVPVGKERNLRTVIEIVFRRIRTRLQTRRPSGESKPSPSNVLKNGVGPFAFLTRASPE